MAIIRVVKYDGTPDMLAWKYPETELGTWTQLIVNETQEALFFKDGQALDLLPAGRHTLSTANIPILSNLVNLPFGGDSPFAAEVWFINKAVNLDVKWGTAKPLQLQDPRYKIMISVRSFGQFGIQVEDARKFLLKLNGTLPQFDTAAIVKHFRGVLMSNIIEYVSGYLVHRQISLLEISAYMGEISRHIEQRLVPAFAEFGIRLTHFYVESINTPEDDPGTARLREALAKRAEMDILGYTYQQERTFDTLEGAARNEGGSSSALMGAGLGLGMGYGVGGAFGSAMGQLSGSMDAGPSGRSCPSCQAANPEGARFCISCGTALQVATPPAIPCSNCGQPLMAGSKFCGHCGDRYLPCPGCGTDNAESAASCSKCGRTLNARCPSCGIAVTHSGKHCIECGSSLQLGCGACGHEVQPGQKFCLECGNKLD